MADVYKFRVDVKGLENVIWREIEVSSLSSVAKLGYSVLAAFQLTGSHLFNLKFNNKRYEILFEEPEVVNEPIIDPIKTKVSEIKLTAGDVIDMQYDYGAGWEFSIKLISITEMKKRAGSHYPFITDGKGSGLIEDISPYQLIEMVKKTDEEGVLPKIYIESYNSEIEWDYRHFLLKDSNILFKGEVYAIQEGYEEY